MRGAKIVLVFSLYSIFEKSVLGKKESGIIKTIKTCPNCKIHIVSSEIIIENGEMEMIGYYNYTVILTYLSLISALFGTHLAFKGNIVEALCCLLLCGAFDSLDGMVARTKKGRTEAEKKFGIQIDSLVDMFSFGIFPAIIGYTMGGLNGWIWFLVFALYAICAVSRLGYFNVFEELRQQETNEKRKYYQGLPVTSSSLIFPIVYFLKPLFGVSLMRAAYGVVMGIVALLFVLDFKIKKPGLKAIIGFILAGAVVFFGLLFVG